MDLQRAQQARYGTEPHPDAALLASRLAHVVADSRPRPTGRPGCVHLAGPAVPHVAGPGATVDPAAAPARRRPSDRPGRPDRPRRPAPGGRQRHPARSPRRAPPPRPRQATATSRPSRSRPPALPACAPAPRRGPACSASRGTPPLGVVEGPASATTKAPAAVRTVSGGDLLDGGGASDPGLRAVAPCGTAGANPDLPLPAAAAALVLRPRRPDRAGQRRAAAAHRPDRGAAARHAASPGWSSAPAPTAQLVTRGRPGPGPPAPVGRPRPRAAGRRARAARARPRTRHRVRRWTAELERMARVGTWRYELATGTLHRSEPLQELYREIGVEPDGSGGPVEGEQVALLVRVAARRTPACATTRPSWRCRACGSAAAPRSSSVRTARPARLIGVVRDVTGQHDLEARARHAARRFADLAALVPTGVAIVDRDGVVREVNPALCALLDAAPEQLRGLPVAALCAEPGPTRARPPSTARWARRCPAGCGRCRPAPRTATRWRPSRCCAATGRRCGASWPSRRPPWTTTAGSGCWPAPTSASSAGPPSCCAAPAPSTS